MIKVFFLIIVSFILISCNKDTPPRDKPETQKTQPSDDSNETDSTMTPEEAFSSALVQDILGEDDDVDLQVYLEEQIYPVVSKSDKITMDRISSSVYLISYNDGGSKKNILIQKFYNPIKDEFVFEKNDTDMNSVKQLVK